MAGVRPRHWSCHLYGASSFEAADLTSDGSLPAVWAAAWAAAPAAPVLLDPVAGRRWVRAGELDERSALAAEALLASGLRPGDRVLWGSGPSIDGVVSNVGALRAGLTVVPVNPAYTRREVAHIVGDVRPEAAIMADAAQAAWVQEAAPGAVMLLDTALRVRSTSGTIDCAAGARALPDATAPALVAYTSGTTGAPKGAVLSHANLLANSRSLALSWGWSPDDRLVHALPLFHGHGLCAALYTTLAVGASAVLLPGFDAGSVLDAAESHRATLFFGVPTMFFKIAATGRAGELGRLRLAVSGSAPLAADLHSGLRDQGVDVLERYGMTETLLTISNPLVGERRSGTVGFPFPGVDVEVADDSGEVLVRGPQVFSGYFERPAATADAFDDGWFHTGDLAEVSDGYVRILGRRGDVVISGGYNVYPAEVEDVLLRHRAVAEVAVTGTPSDEWGEVVTAWVVPAEGTPPDPEALLSFAVDQLAPYKRPRLVRYLDELPRNAMGKVRRSELR